MELVIKSILKILFYFCASFIPFLISVAFFTLGERKLLGAIQRREGPAVVGFWGILQPVADGLKLIFKELLVPFKSNIILFISAPIILFAVSIFSFGVLVYNVNAIYSNVNVGLLYLLTISSLGIYGLVLAGWSSNSRYSFLGSLRTIAQMISYEIVFGVVILCVVLTAQSFSLLTIIHMQYEVFFIWPLFPAAVLFIIMALAESNRTPFDLSEAEAELVAGYNTEYSSIIFALFFLAEYANMLILGYIFSYLFLGGWLPPLTILGKLPLSCEFWLSLKVTLVCMLFVQIRGFLPRYRYDQLMGLGWGIFLPFSFFYLFFLCVLYLYFYLDFLEENSIQNSTALLIWFPENNFDVYDPLAHYVGTSHLEGHFNERFVLNRKVFGAYTINFKVPR